MSKVNSRWNGGKPRYDEKTERLIHRRYHEHRGWHQGARVHRR